MTIAIPRNIQNKNLDAQMVPDEPESIPIPAGANTGIYNTIAAATALATQYAMRRMARKAGWEP